MPQLLRFQCYFIVEITPYWTVCIQDQTAHSVQSDFDLNCQQNTDTDCPQERSVSRSRLSKIYRFIDIKTFRSVLS